MLVWVASLVFHHICNRAYICIYRIRKSRSSYRRASIARRAEWSFIPLYKRSISFHTDLWMPSNKSEIQVTTTQTSNKKNKNIPVAWHLNTKGLCSAPACSFTVWRKIPQIITHPEGPQSLIVSFKHCLRALDSKKRKLPLCRVATLMAFKDFVRCGTKSLSAWSQMIVVRRDDALQRGSRVFERLPEKRYQLM